MEDIGRWVHHLITPSGVNHIINEGGLIAVTLIVFAENGIFFAFFLPGDYLLFLAGVFCGSFVLKIPIWLLMICIFIAAVSGSLVGYLFGKYFGERLKGQTDSLFFKKKNLEMTRDYFQKYGSKVLIISRFLPVVRTFSPILAGIVKLDFLHFMFYNLIGGGLWVVLLCGGGFYFGKSFPQIINYVHWVILFFLLITTLTVVRGYLNARKEMNS